MTEEGVEGLLAGRTGDEGPNDHPTGKEEAKPKRMPHGGVGVLVDLITHQDTITWTVFSISLAAEFTLFSIYVTSGDIRADFYLALLGVTITVGGFLVTARSIAYVNRYLLLAQARVHPDDLVIFEVRPPGPSATVLIGYAYFLLGTAWAGLALRIFLLFQFRLP